MYTAASAANQAPSSTHSFSPLLNLTHLPPVLYSRSSDPMGDGSLAKYDKGKGRATNGDVLALDLDSAEEGNGNPNGAFMQMQLVEQQVSSNASLVVYSVLILIPPRTHTFNNAQRQSSPSNPPSRNWARFLHNLHTWLLSKASEFNALTPTPKILQTTSEWDTMSS